MGTTRYGSKIATPSADRGDASVVLTMADATLQRFLTPLTAPRTVTLPTTNLYEGAEFEVWRIGQGAGTLDIGPGLVTIVAGEVGRVRVRYSGGAWVVVPPEYSRGANAHWRDQMGPGSLFALWGEGDPLYATSLMTMAESVAAPTNTLHTVTIIRLVRFRMPKNIALSALYYFSIAALAATAGWKLAIYRADNSAKVWDSGNLATLANAWNVVTTGGTPALNTVTLLADIDYWIAMVPVAVGTTAAIRTPSPPIQPAFFGTGGSPLGGKDIGMPRHAQVATTASAFPNALPAVAAAAHAGTANGSVLVCFVEGNAS